MLDSLHHAEAGLEYVPQGYDPELYKIRHSAAHVLAQAVLHRYPGAKIAIGPPVDDGFYYDFDLPNPLTPDDLEQIEAEMRRILAGAHTFMRREVSADEARSLFADQPYKLELIDGLAGEDASLSVYMQDSFTDLCRGPHVMDTGQINPAAIKLLSASGAYWRGDESRPMLQRIYGTAWRTPEELEHYLWQREEAEKRDHRKLGKQLELFHFEPTAPGMPYWLPNGLKLMNTLLTFWRDEHEARDYHEISAPLINDSSLWKTSGHWEHYKDDMFLIPVDEQTTYGLKPMNCPNAMILFNVKPRSYRDLPLRLSDCDILHRHERSGTLHGLMRVQRFTQDDAHIFVTEDQIEDEYGRVFEIADRFYSLFGLKYMLRLGTRPESFIGDIETWDRAEAALRRILDEQVGPGSYQVLDGDGAFYGPKVDIVMEDALGRQWQMGTIQLDFQLPRRFNCLYTDKDGNKKHPVVIHRVIYGSMERFIGILIEHTAGVFPVWLSPVQVKVIPVSDRHVDYARQVLTKLKAAGLRAEVDAGSDRMQKKIREAQGQKIPYMLIVGDREQEGHQVSVRLRTEEDLGSMSLADFVVRAKQVIEEKQGL